VIGALLIIKELTVAPAKALGHAHILLPQRFAVKEAAGISSQRTNSSSPRTRGPRSKRLKSLGSRFRGNDGDERDAARFLGFGCILTPEDDRCHSSNQMCAYPSAKAGPIAKRRGLADWIPAFAE
jgi:hypothetical protein